MILTFLWQLQMHEVKAIVGIIPQVTFIDQKMKAKADNIVWSQRAVESCSSCSGYVRSLASLFIPFLHRSFKPSVSF